MKAILDIAVIICVIYAAYLLFFKHTHKIVNEHLGNLIYKVGETETFYLENTKTYGSAGGSSLFGYLLKNGKAYETLFSKNASIMFPDRENCGSILVLDNKSFDYKDGYLKPVYNNGVVENFVECSALQPDALKCTYWQQNYGTETDTNFKFNFIAHEDGKDFLTVWNYKTEKPSYQVISVHKKDATWTVFSPAKSTAYRGNRSGHVVNVNSFDTINNQKVYKMKYSDAQ